MDMFSSYPDILCRLVHSTRLRFLRRRAPPIALSVVDPWRPVLESSDASLSETSPALDLGDGSALSTFIDDSVCRALRRDLTKFPVTLSTETRVPCESDSLFLRGRDETPRG